MQQGLTHHRVTHTSDACHAQSPSSSCPSSPYHPYVYSLYWVSISVLQIRSSIPFLDSIRSLIYSIHFSLSDSLHSAWQSIKQLANVLHDPLIPGIVITHSSLVTGQQK